MYEVSYLDWRTKLRGSVTVQAGSFEAARVVGEGMCGDWEVLGVRRLEGR